MARTFAQEWGLAISKSLFSARYQSRWCRGKPNRNQNIPFHRASTTALTLDTGLRHLQTIPILFTDPHITEIVEPVRLSKSFQ